MFISTILYTVQRYYISFIFGWQILKATASPWSRRRFPLRLWLLGPCSAPVGDSCPRVRICLGRCGFRPSLLGGACRLGHGFLVSLARRVNKTGIIFLKGINFNAILRVSIPHWGIISMQFARFHFQRGSRLNTCHIIWFSHREIIPMQLTGFHFQRRSHLNVLNRFSISQRETISI